MILTYEPFPENTEAGKAFLEGWDRFHVKTDNRLFWDPVDNRWETYPRGTFTFVLLGMPTVPVDESYFGRRTTLREVLNLGAASRVLDPKAIWDPRDGRWYRWQKTQQVPPPPPPPPAWLRQLNADLDAVSANTHMTPEEKAQAREGLIKAAYSHPHSG